ncbi:hypothetical protein A7979_05275 [Rothia nasimurium]|uniref:Uncharacterized protein n=1 Tax=Rothia nasimurium TaxID=85336 RepID=A0A1Y1RP90_9MICC|nr:hypothetical protein A7979_05275 [Rothia nasimurium]
MRLIHKEFRECRDVPSWQRETWMAPYTAISSRELAKVTTSVLDITTGQEPATLRALVREEPLPSPQHRILMIAGYYGTKAPASQGAHNTI